MDTTDEKSGSIDQVRSVNVGDISMGYRVSGSGHPLLLIMGYGSTMNLWEQELIRKLASRFRVIIFDNRGIGSSTTGTKAFSIEQFGEDTSGLLDALGIRQAHVLGWSMGSLIAQELVLQHPSKVSKLVLYASHCRADMFPASPEVIGQLTDMTGTPQERGMRFIGTLFPDDWIQNNGKRIGEIFFRPMGNIPGETMEQQSMAIDTWKGSADRLGEFRSPVMLLSGADDSLVVPQNSRFMSEKIPGSQLDLVAHAGHGLMFQFPEIFYEKVAAFLG